MKKLSVFAVVLLLSAGWSGSASANWWSHTWHKFKHSVSHVTHVVATGVETAAKDTAKEAKVVGKDIAKAAKDAARFVKEHAKTICKKAIPKVLNVVVGKYCKSAAAQAEADCLGGTAEMDALGPEGVAASAAVCTGLSVDLYADCKASGKFAVRMIKPLTSMACNKI